MLDNVSRLWHKPEEAVCLASTADDVQTEFQTCALFLMPGILQFMGISICSRCDGLADL